MHATTAVAVLGLAVLAAQGLPLEEQEGIAAECSNKCPKILRPVCGSNGVTYNNDCLLRYDACRTRSTIATASRGICPEQLETGEILQKSADPAPAEQGEECVNKCPKILRPVCASNGVTYNNDCLMNYDACRSRSVITTAFRGRCPEVAEGGIVLPKSANLSDEEQECDNDCPKIIRPVCGSDGVTYDNLCLLNFASCKSEDGITEVAKGRCPENSSTQDDPEAAVVNRDTADKCKDCTKILRPVCGSDGNTYNNVCLLEKEACIKDETITVANQGICKDQDARLAQEKESQVLADKEAGCNPNCPKILRRVCGTNGATYANSCLLRLDACRTRASITVRHTGQCKDDEEVKEENQEEEDGN